LIRKQVILGQTLQAGLPDGDATKIAGVINQVIERDPGWLKFYRDTIDGLEVSNEALQKVKEREAQLAVSAVAECAFMTKLWERDLDGARTALLDVINDTALADAKLAGWYSMWLGMTYESENDLETAIIHYKKARARLSTRLNVPFRSKLDAEISNEGPKTVLQHKLLTINKSGFTSLAEFVSDLKAQEHALNNKEYSSNVHEEALRRFGELLGYSASRPDNEIGIGPDVIWKDDDQREVIAFELKTKKYSPAEYSKQDIGQAHNHIQWLKDEYQNHNFGGLLIVGPPGECRKEASPSDSIYLVETDNLISRMRMLIAKIEDVRGKTAIERWTMFTDIGSFPEWQISGWFKALGNTLIKKF
jgi:tetratricopeptide (TPR) repeat protein